MSASLVGSEMCIRDRSKVGQGTQCKARQCMGWHDKAGQGSAGQGRRRRAVSYTHLTLPTICSV
eukprot:5333586-Alexandrium_andersonii.AAC.1